jgi:tRNA threonylcarbamoyl adenosine modification protein YeaZ
MNAHLAIDCAFPEAVLALAADGRVSSCRFAPQRSHALRLLPALERLLDEHGVAASQLRRIGVGQGPGSFTGLRVALASAAGLAQAVGAELVGFATFDALPVHPDLVLYAFDARSGRVYAGLRHGERWLEPPLPRPIAAAQGMAAPYVFGDGPDRYPELAEGRTRITAPWCGDPERMLALTAAAQPGKPVLPTYKESAQAQRLFGSPDIGRALDGDEISAAAATDDEER